MMDWAAKRREPLAYRMSEYVITDEAEKLAEQWRGRKTLNLATEAEHMGEISVIPLITIKVLKPSNYVWWLKSFFLILRYIQCLFPLSWKKNILTPRIQSL